MPCPAPSRLDNGGLRLATSGVDGDLDASPYFFKGLVKNPRRSGDLLLGLSLIWIDWTAGLPFFWKIWEGPFITVVGLAMIWSARRLPIS